MIVAATLGVGTAIVTESTLSFLGLGFPPDVPTWGRMLYDAQNHITTAPYLAFFPGLAVFLGLGFPPDVPTWGRMLYDAQNHITTAPYLDRKSVV